MFSVGLNGLEVVKEAGFNTAHTYFSDPEQLRQFLEKADKLELKTLVFPGDRADKGSINNEKVKQFIYANKNSKAILAWYIADEPELNGGTPLQIEEINSFIKKLDHNHPTAVVIHRTDRFKEYRNASDILIIDRYPVPSRPLSHVAEAAALGSQAER